MHYPFWYVPGLTSPMLIAIVATLHVFVAMFAVGGGFVLALGARVGYRTGDRALLTYFRSFSWFFVLITVVYGAISGVGIWWTIGLASPLATETLIRTFVFVWGMEYAAFIVEVVSAFVFFYGWGRLDERTHQRVGWLYAGAAWLSLVLITGITAFMLHSGRWAESGSLWHAFWNPQTIPQTIARTGASLLLAALYIVLHAAVKTSHDEALRARVAGIAARWAMVGGVLVIAGGAGWFALAPRSAQLAVIGSAPLNILTTLLLGLTALIIGMLYIGPWRNPRWINLGFALLLFAMGFAATAAGEFVREAVRKPYVVHGDVMSNGVRVAEVAGLRRGGYLNGGVWTRRFMQDRFPQTISAHGAVDAAAVIGLPRAEREEVGRVLFQYHCNSCHATVGYNGVGMLTRGWTPTMMLRTIAELNRADTAMPPWCGTPEEAWVLAEYLHAISQPLPPGLVDETGRTSR